MLIVTERLSGFSETTDSLCEMPNSAEKKPRAVGAATGRWSGQANRLRQFSNPNDKMVHFQWPNIPIQPVASSMRCPSLREEREDVHKLTEGE